MNFSTKNGIVHN